MKDQETKHTPDTPYKEDEYNVGHIITDKPGLENWQQSTLCNVSGNSIDEIKSKAAFIVKACNSYEDMLEALKQTLSMCEQTLTYRENNGLTSGNVFLTSAIETAKKVINKATPSVS